jgi:hypothetical protein
VLGLRVRISSGEWNFSVFGNAFAFFQNQANQTLLHKTPNLFYTSYAKLSNLTIWTNGVVKIMLRNK